ncbi:MAG: dipeptide/tripeptide permease, partial [Bradymonadia bacterium]
GLIAVGSGGIKPCVSAHVGDQFGKSNWHLLQKIYNAFYFIINFGSAFATLIIPWIRGKEISPGVYEGSVSWAFGVPGILMGLATIAFWMGRHSFVHVPATHPGKKGLLDVLAGAALFMVIGFPIFFMGMMADWFSLKDDAGKIIEWGGIPSVWIVCAIISAVCLVLFTVLFSIRQRIEPDDGFLALTFLAIKSKITRKDVGPGVAPTSANVDDLRNHWLYGSVARTHGSRVAEGPMAVWKIISVFIFICVFWALFDQHSSTWIAQAKDMDRVIDLSMTGFIVLGALMGLLMGFIVVISVSSQVVARWALIITGFIAGASVAFILGAIASVAAALVAGDAPAETSISFMIFSILGGGLVGAAVFTAVARVTTSKWLTFAMLLIIGCGYGYLMGLTGPHELQPSQVPALNPFMVMVLIPLTTFGLYPLLDKLGWTTHPLRRMTMGMMAAGFSFVIVALIQQQLDDGETMHIAWQILPYLVLTLAEVMVSITGLEFAYTQAPTRMKSVIMGFWLFNVSLGNLLVALIAQMPELEPESFFWLFAWLMFGAASLFALRAKFYRYKDYSQDDAKADAKADPETAETFA